MSRSKRPKADRVDGYTPSQPPATDPWQHPSVLKQVRARAAKIAKRDERLDEMERFDSWKNELTGIGDYLRDKTLGGQQGGPDFVVTLQSGIVCENLWRGSDLGGRIVETIPDEMTREGWEVTVQPSDDDEEAAEGEKTDAFPPPKGATPAFGSPAGGPPIGAQSDPVLAGMPPEPPADRPEPIEQGDDEGAEIVEKLQGKLEELNAADVFWEALCYERAFGGAGVLMGIDDGVEDLSQPLDDDATFDDVTHLTAFRGGWDGELIAWSYYRDPTQANYGMPEIYMLRNLGVPIARVPAPGSKLRGQEVLPPQQSEYSVIISWIHESRLLVFPGTAVSRRARVQMRGWGDSVFTRCAEVLAQYDQTWGSVANLMTDWSQGVLKVEGLTDRIMSKGPGGASGGGLSAVTKKAMGVQMARSIARVMMLDSKDEFARDTVSLGGISDVLEQFALRLAAAADMPVDLLMGQGAGGALNKGDTTYRFFMDRVAARQKKRMLPQLRELIRWIFRSQDGPTDGNEPEKWTVKMAALYQESDKERADRQLVVAQADNIYLTQGVVTPAEVAATRFAGSEYSDGPIVIDFDGRREMADQDQADREARQTAMVQSATKNQQKQEQAEKDAKAAQQKGPPAGGEGEGQPGEKPKPGEGGDKGGGSHKVTIAISKDDAAAVRVEPEAERLFVEYMRKNPKVLAHEIEGSGVADPVGKVGEFFAVELQEPEHADVWAEVQRLGVMTAELMRRWVAENAAEFKGDASGPDVPSDHHPLARVPAGGSCCANCRFVDAAAHTCNSPYYQKWNGSPALPADVSLERLCSDWWERAPSARGDDGDEDLVQMLSEDFPPDAVEWAGEQEWDGPREVPLDQVDWKNAGSWDAAKHHDRVEKFKKKIRRGWKKPVVLVRRADGDKFRVVDGHHRALAYREMDRPIVAFSATVEDAKDYAAALEMHDQQKAIESE